MYRTILEELKRWKNQENHSVLLLKGGIKVGKTWVLREFGRLCFSDVLYVDCLKTGYMSYIAGENMEPERILRMLGMYHGKKIKAGETLLIFDEVQAIPGLLGALLRFTSNCPKYHVCCTGYMPEGELPDIAEGTEQKPEILTLKPLNFREFLHAAGRKQLTEHMSAGKLTPEEKTELSRQMRIYALVGGMPEAVCTWLQTGSLAEVRGVQELILETCAETVAKHFPTLAIGRIKDASERIAEMLSKENKEWTGLKDEEVLAALMQSGFIYKVNRIEQGIWPPESYIEEDVYQLYFMDTGLLSSIYNITEMSDDRLYLVRNGAVALQLIWQELYANENITQLYYWRAARETKVDFLFHDEKSMIPVCICMNEEERQNGLTQFRKLYAPPAAVKISRMQTKQEQDVLTIPIFGIWNL